MSTTLPSHPCPYGCGRLVADAHMNSRVWRDRDREANAHLRANSQGGACTPCARRHREDPDPAHIASLEAYLAARRPHRERARAARLARATA